MPDSKQPKKGKTPQSRRAAAKGAGRPGDVAGAERLSAEDALRASEEKYKFLVEATKTGYVILDENGLVTDANAEYLRMSGHERLEEILGRSPAEWTAEHDRARNEEEIRKCAATGFVRDFEIDYVHRDGRIVSIELSASVTRVDGVVRISTICRDITERKEAKQRLIESERRYFSLFDAATDGIFILDLDGRFVDANRTAYERLGYTREELLALDIRSLDSPAFAEQVPERFRMLRERGMAVFESAHRRKDGTMMPVEVNSRLLEYEGRTVFFSVIRDITERKRAQEEIAAQKAILRQVFDASNVGIGLVDLAGRFTLANRRMVEMFGHPMEEFIGSEYLSHLLAAERERGAANMGALLRGEMESTEVERSYVRKDGSVFCGRLAARRFLDVHGATIGVVGVITDITVVKRAEEALRASEKMLQAIFDAEPECVKLLDEEGKLIMMNRAGLDMLEAESLDQIEGRDICPMVAPGHRPAFIDLVRGVFRGETRVLEFEMVGVKGRRLWMETHAVPLRNEKDEIMALLGVTRDVTEKRAAGEALKASEARFRAIIENASAGILVADEESRRFVYANPQICRMLGYTVGELLAQGVSAIHPAGEQRRVAESFAARRGVQTLCLRKDGAAVPVDIKAVEISLEGRPCLAGFFTDMTERSLLEEERLKTQKLESVGMLAGGIAHDFNNLLQGVFGYISLARMAFDQKDRALTMLDEAEKALHQASNLTFQLLTFAKGGKPVKRLVALEPVIGDAARLALSGSRSGCRLDVESGLWRVEADEGQVGQVIQNIVLNADQAMPLGGTVEISARNLPANRAAEHPDLEARDYIELAISDQGAGIPEGLLGKIFDPYFTTKEKGSGLGLATSYSIIRNHGGRIEVRSEPGRGSTFLLYLPASQAAAGEAESAEAAPRMRSGRALVMDDEPVVRSVAGDLLRAIGFAADVAENGETALEKYERAKAEGRPFDVVILDLTVRGGMGGGDTLRRLLELDPAVRAVVTSGYADSAILSSYRDLGFRGVLKKPFLLDELRQTLDEALR